MPWKVIHIITRLDRGGSAQNTLLTAIGHEPTRFESLVVAGQTGQWDDQGGDLATEQSRRRLEVAGVRCLFVPTLTREIRPIKDLATLVTLVSILRREKPTIVHTHTSKGRGSGPAGCMAGRGSHRGAYASRPCLLRTFRAWGLMGISAG